MSEVIHVVQEDKFIDFIKIGKGLKKLPTREELKERIYAMSLETLQEYVREAEEFKKLSLEARNLCNYIVEKGKIRLARESFRGSGPKGGRPKKTLPHGKVLSQSEMEANSKLRAVDDDVLEESFNSIDITKQLWTPNQAKQLQKEKKKEEEREKLEIKGREVEKLPDRLKIFNCDFVDLEVEDESIDLIFTDPPYPKEFLPQYESLAKWASQKLKPDGLLFAYCSHPYIDKIYAMLSEHLTFLHTFCLKNTYRCICRPWNVLSWWRPVVCYARQGRCLNDIDFFNRTDGADKPAHDWQQGLEEATWFIEKFSAPGGLVCDPFLGSGTSAIACPDNRKFLGAENNEKTFAIAKGRIKNELV